MVRALKGTVHARFLHCRTWALQPQGPGPGLEPRALADCLPEVQGRRACRVYFGKSPRGGFCRLVAYGFSIYGRVTSGTGPGPNKVTKNIKRRACVVVALQQGRIG